MHSRQAAAMMLKIFNSVFGFLGGLAAVVIYFDAMSLTLDSLGTMPLVQIPGIFISMLVGAWIGIWLGFVLWLLILRSKMKWQRAEVEAVLRGNSAQSLDSLTAWHLNRFFR